LAMKLRVSKTRVQTALFTRGWIETEGNVGTNEYCLYCIRTLLHPPSPDVRKRSTFSWWLSGVWTRNWVSSQPEASSDDDSSSDFTSFRPWRMERRDQTT
jgi:hypothetical protein